MSVYSWENQMVTTMAPPPPSSCSTIRGGARSDNVTAAKRDASDETVTRDAGEITTIHEHRLQGQIYRAQGTSKDQVHDLLGQCFDAVNSEFGNKTLGTYAGATSADEPAADRVELTDFSDSCTTDSDPSVSVNSLVTNDDASLKTSAGDDLLDKVSTRSADHDSTTKTCGGPAAVLTCIETPNTR